uniref:MAM domain-containing protein n=1 Tax=Plectus sambesii TaxID=2011161 RepID=A0A914VBF2_9BILA
MSAYISSELGGYRSISDRRLKSYTVARSRFVYRCPAPQRVTNDEEERDVIVIEHATGTALDDVGLQVWIGSLLLADYLYNQPQSDHSVILELGAGAGLTSIALATTRRTVIATDYHFNVLRLLESNASTNDTSVRSKLLDWRDGGKFKLGEHRFLWSRDDFELLTRCRTLVAADCIYDLELNKALFALIESLIENLPIEELLFSVDERVNFDADTLTVASPAYDDLVEWLDGLAKGGGWRTELVCVADIDQFFAYDRTDSRQWSSDRRRFPIRVRNRGVWAQIAAASDLNCDFETPCRWRNGTNGLDDTFDWNIGSSVVLDSWHSIPRSKDGYGDLFAYTRGAFSQTAQDVALLVSETINCQVGVGRLSFWFWKTANLPSLEVCVRIPPGRNSGLSCYSAITGIHSQEWVLHITELPPIEQPFEIVFKASFSANFDIIGLDEISYDATICGE